MFDSNSDSDMNSTAGLNPESSDVQILAEVRQDQLQEENASLVKEINVLRAQFEQAVAMSNKANDLLKEIDSLKQQLYEANSQKEDVSRRLEISIRARDEALRQLDEEHFKNAAQRESDVKTMQKELIKTKKAFQGKLDDLYSENQKLQQEKDADDVSQKTLVGKIDKMVINSSHFLNRNVGSFDELCAILEGPCPISTVSAPANQEPPKIEKLYQEKTFSAQQMKELTRKLKRAKEETKAALNKLNELSQNLQQKESQIETITFQRKEEVEALNDRLKQMKDDMEKTSQKNATKISDLQNLVRAMKSDLQKKQRKEKEMSKAMVISQVNAQQKMPDSQPISNDHSSDDKLINDQLSTRINELTQQIALITDAKDELKDKLEKSEKTIANLKLSHQNEHNELNALRTVHKETVNEIEAIRAALHARKENVSKKEQIAMKKEQNRQKAEYLQIQNTNEQLKKHVFDVQLENEKNIHILEEQRQKMDQMNATINDFKEKVTSLNGEIIDLKQKIASSNVPTEEDFMPRSTWTLCDFDSQLVQNIAKIANNEALRAPSKLQNIYKAINKFYSKQIQAIKGVADEANNDSQRMFAYMNDFIVSLSIALNDKAESFENFMQHAEVSSALVAKVTALRSTNIDLTRARDSTKSLIESIASTFGVTNEMDIYSRMSEIRKEFDAQIQTNEKRRIKIRKLKEEKNELLQKSDSEISYIRSENARLNSSLEAAIKHKNAVMESLKQLKQELAKSNAKRESIQSELQDIEEKNINEIEENKQKYEDMISAQKDEFDETIAKMSYELENAKIIAADAEMQFSKYKKAIATQKQTIDEKESEIIQIKQKSENEIKQIIENSKIEKKQIVDNYETAVAELTQQCEKHRSDVIKLSRDLAQMEKKFKDTRASFIQLKHENSRLEKEKKLKAEEFERESKIAQSTIKNASIAAESQCTAKINELKTKHESEKRKIYSYAADELRQFFNANDSLDERTFHSIISMTKDELIRLQKIDSSIRRIVGATGRQSTDDAVAQIVMGTNLNDI